MQRAPPATQVADRFHALKNLVEAFQQLLGREHGALRAAAEAVTGAPSLPTTRPLTAPERAARATTQARRQARYEAVRWLRAEGKTIREIAVGLRMGQNTIQRLVRAECCPVPALRRTRTTLLSAFEPYLRERWNSGEQNGQRLLREIQAQGYDGSQSTLYGLLGRWRTGPRHSGPYARQTKRAAPVPPPLRISPRTVSWRLLCPETERSCVEQAYVETLLQQNTVVATMLTAVTAFFDLLRERRGEDLDAWVAGAKTSGIPELAGFAEGIRRMRRQSAGDCAPLESGTGRRASQPSQTTQTTDVRTSEARSAASLGSRSTSHSLCIGAGIRGEHHSITKYAGEPNGVGEIAGG